MFRKALMFVLLATAACYVFIELRPIFHVQRYPYEATTTVVGKKLQTLYDAINHHLNDKCPLNDILLATFRRVYALCPLEIWI